ncbi:MAG TPA: homocysteine S-methyltransferase family protein, partial [Ilumatobacteraceae bacterium]|nr:homocysteine S-methyltransferase family protein [Ilumatobacteraceae bacterium]
YFDSYATIAVRDRVGVVLETATWRASPDWAARRGYSLERLDAANRDAVELLRETRRRHETAESPIVISGCIGPRGDGYQAGALMTADEAAAYHSRQAAVFADAGADLITAITMTYPAEAVGVTEAARTAGMPVVISFTVETDGHLPTGQSLAEAIDTVDRATGSYPLYYMVNCAHPTHFAHRLDAEQPWVTRIRGIRANASKMSHAELDEAETLDGGDPDELAKDYRSLRAALPQLTVLGGCCGTNHHHISAISAEFSIAG